MDDTDAAAREALWKRPARGETARLRAGGNEIVVTAWATIDGELQALEAVDCPAALRWLREALGSRSSFELAGPAGDRTAVEHHPAALAKWSASSADGDGAAVGYWTRWPVGRMALDIERAVPGAEQAPSLLAARQPLTLVLDALDGCCLMLAAPQALRARDDGRMLAEAFAGLLRDCYHLPLPASPRLSERLWRSLREAPDFAEIAEARRRAVAAGDGVGVADVDGADVGDGDGPGRAADPSEPVRLAEGGGVRCWRIAPEVRDAALEELRRLAAGGEWSRLLEREDIPSGGGEEGRTRA